MSVLGGVFYWFFWRGFIEVFIGFFGWVFGGGFVGFLAGFFCDSWLRFLPVLSIL